MRASTRLSWRRGVNGHASFALACTTLLLACALATAGNGAETDGDEGVCKAELALKAGGVKDILGRVASGKIITCGG